MNKRILKLKEQIVPEVKRYRAFGDLNAEKEMRTRFYRYPFKHIVVDDFLAPEHYQTLTSQFDAVLAKGLWSEAEGDPSKEFTRLELYDLYGTMPKPTLDAPLGFFYSESYFKMLEDFLEIAVSRDTYLTFHHHEPSVRDNYVHTDFIPGYFVDDPLPNGVNAWHYQCDHHKEPPAPGLLKRRRAIAVVYYLSNYPWEKSLGGETGIFETDGRLVRKIPPVNNRLTAFEITPTSFHNFMKNNSPSRNSIAQWFFVE